MVSPEQTPQHLKELPSVVYECERCGEQWIADLGTAFVTHPAVVSFYYDRGVDVRDGPLWRFAVFTNDRARFLDGEPTRASVTYSEGTDRLTLTVDDSLSVLDVERTTA
jgi:hypothetical protein